MKIYIESQVPNITSTDAFQYEVINILNFPRGWGKRHLWERTKIKLKADYEINLVTNKYITNKYGKKFNMLSCAEVGGRHAYINVERWTNGSVESKLDLPNYKIYVINHEVGHLLGLNHPTDDELQKIPPGSPCPVMVPQTSGVCPHHLIPNEWL